MEHSGFEDLNDKLGATLVRSFLLDLSTRLPQEKDELNTMDAACGDGDFGTTIQAAFTNLGKTVEQTRSEDIGAIFTAAGNAILASAGGAAGPLFATFFIEAGKAAYGKNEVDLAGLAMMVELSARRIQTRGGANVGDKTLLDGLLPAVESLQEAASAHSPMVEALEKAVEAATAGYESTKQMVAKHGRARYLGEQTLGYADPGAKVMLIIFETLLDSYKSRTSSSMQKGVGGLA